MNELVAYILKLWSAPEAIIHIMVGRPSTIRYGDPSRQRLAYLVISAAPRSGSRRLSDHLARNAMKQAGAAIMTEQFRAIGLHHAMYLIPILCLVLTGVLFAAARAMPPDVEKLRKLMHGEAIASKLKDPTSRQASNS